MDMKLMYQLMHKRTEASRRKSTFWAIHLYQHHVKEVYQQVPENFWPRNKTKDVVFQNNKTEFALDQNFRVVLSNESSTNKTSII